ncbi:unnamed protein product [Alternaria alternata]
MADLEQQTPIEGTPVNDIEMEGAGGAEAGAGETTLLPEIEPETPKLVLFADARDAPLEKDPRQPSTDNEGLGLLVHARIYTLADRLQLPELKSLAHSKIHRTASTAKGELAYARYVYKESNPEDATIRKPVAAFWATRSYSLRHDAEPEFKAMCLEFPQFSYDVLQLVLDQQEKKRGGDEVGRAWFLEARGRGLE